MVRTINLNKTNNSINLNKPTNNINLNKPSHINLDKPAQNSRREVNEPGNFQFPSFGQASGGLVPIWDTGFYVTPDEPADPRDCERYPDSPYCGSNPFTFSPGGVEPEIVVDQCDVGIRLNPSLGFIRLPPVSFVYRRPECRVEPEERLTNTPDEVTTHPPLPNCPTSGDRIELLSIACPTTYNSWKNYFEPTDIFSFPGRGWAEVERIHKLEVLDFTYPYQGGSRYCYVQPNQYSDKTRRTSSILTQPIIYLRIRRTTTITSNDLYKQWFEWQQTARYEKADTFTNKSEYENVEIFDIYLSQEMFNLSILPQPDETIIQLNLVKLLIDPYPYNLAEKDLLNSMGISIQIGNCSLIASNLERTFAGIEVSEYSQGREQVVYEVEYECIFKYFPIPPQSPNMPNNCCPDDLLRLLIQKIDRLSEVVGIDEYPATVPESFISTQGGFLNQEIPIPNIQIASLTKFLEWYVKRFDELMGQWEIPIEIKDSDPTTTGDQGLGFKLPNMAEAIAEIFLLLLQTSINTETLLNMNTRTMLEVGQDKQQNFKSYMLIDAIADYLGFKYDEKKFKLPMLFDIGKEDYAELLKEKETEVTAAEFNDKQNFQEALHRLLEGAAITKSAHFRKLNANTDMKKQIIDIIKNYSKTNKQAQQKDDFDAFIEDVETGFINTPGISDASNPYGRDYSQRPRIREIGNTSDQD